MKEESTPCPKCGGEMEKGWLPDDTYGGVHRTAWTAGDPQRGLLGSIVYPKRDATLPISAFRCCDCGFIEHYAAKV